MRCIMLLKNGAMFCYFNIGFHALKYHSTAAGIFSQYIYIYIYYNISSFKFKYVHFTTKKHST